MSLFSGVCDWLSICGYVQVHKVKIMLDLVMASVEIV